MVYGVRVGKGYGQWGEGRQGVWSLRLGVSTGYGLWGGGKQRIWSM